MVSEVEAKTKTKGNAMNNPIAKNKMFDTLNANEVAEMIAAMSNPIDRNVAYMIYYGTVNMLSECVDATIEAYNHRDAREYPVVTD
tara:strand:+ start:1096 stop:1353 length:258 start_codon:yes stop_codon:yes gene_type:complete